MARSGKPKTHTMKKFETKARKSPGIGCTYCRIQIFTLASLCPADNPKGQTDHPLTMQQEARNTGRSIWLPESKLRHKPVGFVKGDCHQPESIDEQTYSKHDEPCELETKTEELNIKQADDDDDDDGEEDEDDEDEDRDDQNEDNSNGPAFFVDLSSQSVAPTRLPNPTSNSHSPIPEDSSGDEIVFHGRNRRTDQREYSQRHPIVEDEFMFSKPEPVMMSEEHDTPRADPRDNADRDRRAPTKGEKSTRVLGSENEILADYIANIDVGYEETASQDSLDLVEIRDSASLSSNDELQDIDLDADLRIDDDSVDNEEAEFENIESLRRLLPGQGTTTTSKNRTPISASRFADALESDPYYGFDIMDFDRPSLKKKPKGKKTPPDFMMSDSELEMEMENVWMNDREKKKNRKQKREELRSSGLLGRSAEKPDLRSKYADGISFDDMKSEIRAFLLSSKDR